MMTNGCLSCTSSNLHENKTFATLPRVTSDSVPFAAGGRIAVCLDCGLVQKPIDDVWKKEIGAIYGAYDMYSLTGGMDQTLFSAGGATRADSIAAMLHAQLPADFSGSIIDIGCGTGGFLKAFGQRFPKARLYGKEISDANLKYLRTIPNFEKLYTASDATVDQQFDVITSIHCFEHLYDYAAFFRELESIKKPDTLMLLQVPDMATSPYDIAIADHAGHFTAATLHACLGRYVPHYSVAAPMDKELTAILWPHACAASAAPAVAGPATAAERIAMLDAQVDALARFLARVDAQADEGFGVYGTTIAGAWLTGAFEKRIAFYVDDDVLKQGKQWCGKPILAPADVPAQRKVVLPFTAPTRKKILGNHPNLAAVAVYAD
jgi:SAM-dependent methyltransferase